MTNSSLLALLPVTAKEPRSSCPARVPRAAFETELQVAPGGDPRGRDQALPEAGRQPERIPGGQVLARLRRARGGEVRADLALRALPEPGEDQGEAVAPGRQLAGAPGRELQDRRAAEPPVGDERGTSRKEGLPLDARRGFGDRKALQPLQPRVVDMEGEERGDQGFDRVPAGLRHGKAGGGLAAAGRQQEAIAGQDFAGGEFGLPARSRRILIRDRELEAGSRPQDDAGRRGRPAAGSRRSSPSRP